MGTIRQAKRLLWLDDENANGNAFVALMALSGVVGWGATVLGLQLEAPRWPVMAVWIAAWGGLFVWGYLRVERGSVINLPNGVWFVAALGAFLANGYAIAVENPELLWLPWMAAFAVGYLATALRVARAHVYWVAGLASVALLGHGIYSVLTDTGFAVVTAGSHHADHLAVGTVLLPLPYTYVVLGLLHVVPMAVDAVLGGRQLTDAGVPAVSAEEPDTDDAGGVVPSD